MNINELFPSRWLKADDLKGRTVRVVIQAAVVERIHNPRANKPEDRLIVAFRGKEKRLILNKTQAFALASALQENETTHWLGHEITLSPSVAPNGHPTIQIGKPEPQPAATSEGDAGPPDTDTEQ